MRVLKDVFNRIIVPVLGFIIIATVIYAILTMVLSGVYSVFIGSDNNKTNIVISEKTAFNDTVTIDVYGHQEHAAVTYDKYVIDSDDNITRVTIFKRTTKDGKSTEYVILKDVDKDDYIKDLK